MEGRSFHLIGIALLTVSAPAIAVGQNASTLADGTATRTERRPVVDTTWQEQSRTVYTEQYVTEIHDRQRIVYTPVVEYQWQQYRVNWWNLLAPPEYAFQLKPTVRWETRIEPAQVPVTRREVVPQTEVVRVPVNRLGFEHHPVPGPQLVRRPTATTQAATTTAASPNRIGGVLRIENDPPRVGRAVSGDIRR